tara:strand:+ start:678 stop:911 length:234 start_codon:yes stop_codon:yes gene_type:complete
MYTVEFDEDETLITVLDDKGKYDDVSVFLYDDVVYIRQWNEKDDRFQVIAMTDMMYLKLMSAWTSPEGAFVLEKNYK